MINEIKMIEIKKGQIVKIPQTGSWPETHHIFDERSIWALKSAIASGRPLLIRGAPGTGKSQLARAAAFVMKRAFISEVIHSKSEPADLMWRFDSVARLAESQIVCRIPSSRTDNGQSIDSKDPLRYERFITPGLLWWAYDWDTAKNQPDDAFIKIVEPDMMEGCSHENGCVILIDEIDKADADLPNSLLEAFGNGAFSVPYINRTIGLKQGSPKPLVIITTNEERELPAAFIRRCLVLHLALPGNDAELIKWFVKRGEIHFGKKCSKAVMEEAATQLCSDRKEADNLGMPMPGQAEYIDLLRALTEMHGSSTSKRQQKQLQTLEKIREFSLRKFPGGQD